MTIAKELFTKIVNDSRAARAHVRQLVAQKRWREAEPSRDRFAAYMTRRAAINLPPGAEAMIGDTLDFQGAWFLPEGARVRRAIAYVEVSDARLSDAGSGFLVSPQLFLTNRHVIADENAARAAQITFDREAVEGGRPSATTSYALDPDRFALFSPENELDYALIAVGALISGSASLADLSFCILSDRPDKHVIGMNVNIIQHPRAWPKMIAIRNNILTARTDRTLLYETDTDHGSSGAPVLNDDWELVALHHWGQPFLERKDDQGNPITTNVNEGVRISAIYKDLQQKFAALPPDRQALLGEALGYSQQVPSGPSGKRLSPPHPSADSAEAISLVTDGASMTQPSNANELRITLPIEIIVRLGAPGGIAQVVPAIAVPVTSKSLTLGAEKITVDQDYSNRDGFDRRFIRGVEIPLPEPGSKLAKQVAPLRPGEPDAENGELKYEHFSIKMNKSKRLAIFTATNIDGKAYLNVDRRTGVVNEAEAETWFADSRVSSSFWLDNSFYSEWSNLFDHGHLTRRTDPNWGTADEAERANADTYHFTNCSPQHFRFNESTKFWQGAEQYVLENGALSEDSQNRISVFQGPIFNDKVDRWADDVQIPSSFFKVIVWKGKSGVKSVGIVVDQLALLSEERKSLGTPRPAANVNVSQWRVPISTIEERTSLDFGDVVRNADTIQDEKQPRVGEAQILLTSLDDLLPK